MKRPIRETPLLALAMLIGLGSLAQARIPEPDPPTKWRDRPVVQIYTPDKRVKVPVVDGQFVIQFTSHEDVQKALGTTPFNRYAVGTTLLSGKLPGVALYRVDFPTGLDMNALQAELRRNAYVKRSDPNVIGTIAYVPNDPDFPLQWPLLNDGSGGGTAGADISATDAWEAEMGDADVEVFVIDTGIPMQNGNLSHPELDDPAKFEPLANLMNPGQDPVDDNGHGTHVAGVIAAEMDNGTGIAGIADEVSVEVVKAFNSGGSTTLDTQCTSVALALLTALLTGRPTVLNMSWRLAGGADDVGDGAFESLIAWPSETGNENVLFVIAAGNYGGCPGARPVNYPAAYAALYDEVVAVAATDDDDNATCWSARGPEVTIAAPGEHIWSTTPNYEIQGTCLNPPPDQNYDHMDGTSMATPHVAGVAALLWAADPGATGAQIRGHLTGGADKVGGIPYVGGRNDSYGYGRLNACKSLVQAGAIPAQDCPAADAAPGAKRRAAERGLLASRVASFFPYLLPMMGAGWLRRRLLARR